MKIIGTITGVLMGILGIYAMCVPMRTFLGIGWLIGALLCVNGIQMLIMGLKKEKKDILRCILAVLAVLAGVVLLFNGAQRILTDVLVAYVIGGFILFYGIFSIVNGVETMKASKGVGIFKIICGVISIIAGILAIGHPVMTMISVGYIIAVTLVIQGIDMVVLALSAKTQE